MAYYALQKGYTQCALILENTATAQTFQQPITHAYTSHGGTLVTTVIISPNQTSYRSEILKAFASKPQCVFIANDLPSDNTFFANVRELGFINTPFIGSDYYTDPLEAKAFGPAASTSLTGITSSSGSGAAYDLFTQLYKAQWNATAPEYAISMFDGIMVAALAMTIASSSDPKIWINKVTAVTGNETATECSTYPDCVKLIKQGKALDYEGGNGPLDFDAHHSVYSPISVVQFNSDLKTLHTLLTVSADTIKSYNS